MPPHTFAATARPLAQIPAAPRIAGNTEETLAPETDLRVRASDPVPDTFDNCM